MAYNSSIMKLKRCRNKIVSVITFGLVSLFVSQTSFAQIAFFATFSKQPVSFTQQPLIQHTLLNQVAFSQLKEIASKQMWVGNEELLIHIEARESLKTIKNSLFSLPEIDKSKWQQLFLWALLQMILEEELARPLKQDFKGVKKLLHSA